MPKLNEREINDAFGKYIPIAVTLAKRYQRKLPPGIDEKQDLIQEALLGLFQCLRRYDPARGPLTPWVTQHIKGAILDYLRTRDRFPQEVREEIKRLKAAEKALWQGLMREPTDRELADHLEVSVPEVDELKRWSEIWTLICLDDATLPPPPMPTVPGDAEMATALAQYWENLEPREKVAVELHVHDGARLEDIASVLKVSRATAGRILDTALGKLAKALAPEDHDGE